jgi:hypothetical protein
MRSSTLCVWFVVVFGSVGSLAAPGLAQFGYVEVASIPAPAGAWDVDPSGLIVSVASDGVIRRQVAQGNFTFSPIGSVPSSIFNPSFGPGFLRVSPGGGRIAIGDNDRFLNDTQSSMHVLASADLSTTGPTTTTAITMSSYDAYWSSDSRLFVSGGSFGAAVVRRVDLPGTGPITIAGVNTVITGISGASGGITERSGAILTANGFDLANVETGAIRAFSSSAFAGASGPLAFSTGTFIGQHLTAASLEVEPGGDRLIVGGGGGALVVDPATGVIQPLVTTGFSIVRTNDVTGQIYVQTDGSSTIRVFQIPAPSAIAMLGLAGGVLARRRRAPVNA